MKILTVNSLLNVGPLLVNGGSPGAVVECTDCGQMDRWTDCSPDTEYICIDCFEIRQLKSTYDWQPLLTRVSPIVVECACCKVPFGCGNCNSIPPTGNISCFFKAEPKTNINDIVLCVSCKSLWEALQCYKCSTVIDVSDLYSNISTQATVRNLKYGHSITVLP